MADLLFVGQFIASKAGKTGLTVTVDVDRYTLADGSRTALVTAGSATEGRRGLYHYRLASADLATYQYVATFITADATVDQREIAALGIVVPDALVGSRLAPAVAGRTLDVDASGNASANVTLWKGATAPDAPPTAAAVADAVWATALPGAYGAGTAGKLLSDIEAVAPDNKPTVAATGEASANVTHSAGVAVSGRLAEVTDLPSEPLDATATQAAAAAALTAYDPPTKAELDAGFLALVGADGDTLETLSDQLDGVDANVDAIKLIADDLDLSAVTQVSSSLAGHLTITRGLTFAEAVTGLTIPVDWETAYWTLKRNPVQPDTAALVRLLVTNPAGESDGLQRLKGAEPASPITEADGTLTVTQATGRIDIWLSDELTACLSAGTSLGWDVKFIDSAGDSTGRRGTADVVLTETHATA